MILTFQKDKFVLQADGLGAMGSSEWLPMTANTYSTNKLKAAVRFRKFADPKAERIFSKFMLRSLALPTDGVLFPKGKKLYEYQEHQGVPHILGNNKSYLAHEPGLGKTAQAVCAVNSKPGRALVICPSFLKTTWKREILKWTTTINPTLSTVADKESISVDTANYFIVSDAMLMKPWVLENLVAQDFRYVFIDEGHRFKTPDASRTVALFGGQTDKLKSKGLIYNSEHVCIMSGTPMLNRPIELWSMLYAMAPETIDFMSYLSYGFKFGGAIQDPRGHWLFPGSTNEDELRERIMGKFMQRILKKDVLKDLPDKIREVVYLDQDTRAEDVKKLDAQLLSRAVRGDRPKELGEWAIVRHENGLAKTKWVVSFVDDILGNNFTEQVVLFAHHRDVVEGLRCGLIHHHPLVINGGVPNDERTKIEDLFQQGRRRLIIGNIDSMNLGLTLTKGTRVVFAEYSWTPSSNEQAEDRLHRIGQKDAVLCQYLALPNSIDEHILNSVLTKQERIMKVMG